MLLFQFFLVSNVVVLVRMKHYFFYEVWIKKRQCFFCCADVMYSAIGKYYCAVRSLAGDTCVKKWARVTEKKCGMSLEE